MPQDSKIPQVFTPGQTKLILEKTPKEHIKTRVGPGGSKLSYVEIGYIIKRLNEAFGYMWDFHIDWQEVGNNEVIVRGRLVVKGKDGQTLEKSQYGGSMIKRSKDTKKPLSVADDLKAAGSDALKKCASLFGIAQDVYSKEPEAVRSNGNGAKGFNCSKEGCGKDMPETVANFSVKKYRMPICMTCQYSKNKETKSDAQEVEAQDKHVEEVANQVG